MLFTRKEKVFNTFDELLKDLSNKKNDYYNSSIDKYLISYSVNENGLLEVVSNIGRKRLLVNNSTNMKKLNQKIVKSKVDIIKKIDKYEKEAYLRFNLIIINTVIVLLSFLSVLLSLCVGSSELCILALVIFTMITSVSLVNGFNYYLLIKEVNSLKKSIHFNSESKINEDTNDNNNNSLSVTSLILK